MKMKKSRSALILILILETSLEVPFVVVGSKAA
jgi:hypothetical protein